MIIYSSKGDSQKSTPIIINRKRKVAKSPVAKRKKVIKGGCCFKRK